MNTKAKNEIAIIYDGQCPVCSYYVKGVRLAKAGGNLRLQDARERTPEILALKAAGYDLNQGMVVKVDGEIYFGADGMQVLSLMSSPVSLLNRGLFLVFRSPALGRSVYPVLRSLRLLLLKLLGRPPIE